MGNITFKLLKEELNLFFYSRKKRKKENMSTEAFVKGNLLFGFLDFWQQWSWKVSAARLHFRLI